MFEIIYDVELTVKNILTAWISHIFTKDDWMTVMLSEKNKVSTYYVKIWYIWRFNERIIFSHCTCYLTFKRWSILFFSYNGSFTAILCENMVDSRSVIIPCCLFHAWYEYVSDSPYWNFLNEHFVFCLINDCLFLIYSFFLLEYS